MLQDYGVLASPSGLNGLVATALGLFDVALGMMMPVPSRVSSQPENGSTARVLVDRGVYRTSVYQLAFFDHKLVMKRLATSRTTVLLGLILTLVGAVLVGNPLVGAADGGLTGYVLQEFITQKRRERILNGKLLKTAGSGDVELFYAKVNDVQVVGHRMLVSVADQVYRISFPRGYTSVLRPALEKMIPTLYSAEATRPERAP